jgi:O-acetyl-ADP-ribose deacetylase (regulator of RNase III)
MYAASGLYRKAESHRARSRYDAAFGAGELLGRDARWFANLFGVEERAGQNAEAWKANRDMFVYAHGTLRTSAAPAASWRCGTFASPSVAELRAKSEKLGALNVGRRTALRYSFGDVSVAHDDEAYDGAVFQAASQLNCLEFPDPQKTPADGVAFYVHDRTQGPACAIACAPGTVVRNYFVNDCNKQLNTIEATIDVLTRAAGAHGALVQVVNGYTESTEASLRALNSALDDADARSRASDALRVGVQHDTEVTCTQRKGQWHRATSGNVVTQVYVSALAIAYSSVEKRYWEPLARLILESAYVATLHVAAQTKKKHVVLTAVGGGVFGNDLGWIAEAIARAVAKFEWAGLDVEVRMYTEGDMRDLERRIEAASEAESKAKSSEPKGELTTPTPSDLGDDYEITRVEYEFVDVDKPQDFFTKAGRDVLRYNDGTEETLHAAYTRVKNAPAGAPCASKNFGVDLADGRSWYQLVSYGGAVTQLSHDGARARYVRRVNALGALTTEELRALFKAARRTGSFTGDPYEYEKLARALRGGLESERTTVESVKEAGAAAERWAPLFFAQFVDDFPHYHGFLHEWQVGTFVEENPAYYELLERARPHAGQAIVVDLVDVDRSSNKIQIEGSEVLRYNDGTSETMQSAYLRLELRGGATKNFLVRIGSTTSWYQLASCDAGMMQLSYDGSRRRRVVRGTRSPAKEYAS